MKKFNFRFETVLRVRKRAEDQALKLLAAAQRAHQFELLKKSKLLNDLQNSLLRREGLGQSPVGIVAFQTEQDFISGTKQRLVQADHAIMRASRGVEKAMRSYLAARRQTKTIESLKEKDFHEYKMALRKKEQKELDDLTVMRAHLNDSKGDVA